MYVICEKCGNYFVREYKKFVGVFIKEIDFWYRFFGEDLSYWGKIFYVKEELCKNFWMWFGGGIYLLGVVCFIGEF